MRVAALPRSFYRTAAHDVAEVSDCANERLCNLRRWWNLREHGHTAVEAAALLELPRATLSRWDQRYRAGGPRGLEPHSRRPRRRRQPTWSTELVEAVRRERETPPCLGKDKVAYLLHKRGWQVSVSTVGRILGYLKRRGVLREPPRPGVACKKRRVARPYAIRKPNGYVPTEPGDLVQVDTMDLRPLPGVILKHFTARDVVPLGRAPGGHAGHGCQCTPLPGRDAGAVAVPLKAIQVDGGSEFQGEFEQGCRERGIQLYVLPPHSPKLNGYVECGHRTHQEEFYNFYDGEWTVAALVSARRRRERCYNTDRPRQSLGWLSPMEYLLQCHPQMAPPSHM